MDLSAQVGPLAALPQLMVVGTSYRSSDLTFRERLAAGETEGHIFHALSSVEETALLSTCNRFELYIVTRTPAESYDALLAALRRLPGLEEADRALYQLKGQDAANHLFRVASGLESVVLGEPQILSQVRAAGIRSRTSGDAKGVLSPLFDRAYRVGARVRKSFDLDSGEASLSDLAIEAINRSRPRRQVVLLVGTGKMIRLAARRLKGKSRRLYVVSKRKTPPPGLEWCTLVSRSDVKKVAKKCDILISATASNRPVVTQKDLKGRRKRVVVDLGMPRNVSASVRDLPNVRLIDLDDLAKMEGIRHPPRELREAETAVGREAEEFYDWLVQTRLSTALADLYSWAEAVREEELRHALSRLKPTTQRDQRIVDAMGRRIVSKILARPTEFARRKRAGLSEEEKLRLLKAVFGAGVAGET